MENRTLDDAGWLSIDRCQVTKLQLNPVSQELHADGPGWIESVRRSNGPGLIGDSRENPLATVDARGLTYLHVDFQQSCDGSLARREMKFQEQIRSIYGPVSDWNQRLEISSGDQLVRESAILRCHELTVFQLPGNATAGQIELMAVGNALVEGKSGTGQFFAACATHLLSSIERPADVAGRPPFRGPTLVPTTRG